MSAHPYVRIVRLQVKGHDVRCPVCGGTAFTRRYFSASGAGAVLRRKTNFLTRPLGTVGGELARFYSCDDCSWTPMFAADTHVLPEEVE